MHVDHLKYSDMVLSSLSLIAVSLTASGMDGKTM